MADDNIPHITMGGPGKPIDTVTDVGFQPAQAPAAAPDDFGFQPAAKSPPKVPDVQPVVDMVQKNVAAQQPPATDAQPATPAQQLDDGLGFSASDALKNGAQSLPASLRAPLVQAYKDGTATSAGDYMQSVLPSAAATAVSPASHYAQEAGRDVLGAASWMNPYTIGAHLFDIPLNVGSLAMQFGLRADPTMLDAASKALPDSPTLQKFFSDNPDVPTFGALFDKIGQKLFPDGAPQSDTAKIVDAASQFAGAGGFAKAPSMALKGWNAFTGAVVGGGGEVSQEKAQVWAQEHFPDNSTMQSAISQAAGLISMVGLGTGLHAAGHEALKPMVADAVGKPAEQVTSQDIDQTIAKNFDGSAPKAQDFHDVATVMDAQKPQAHAEDFQTGKPVTINAYHGTPRDFDNFENTDINNEGHHFFTNDTSIAESYAKEPFMGEEGAAKPNIRNANIQMDNPKVIDAGGKTWANIGDKGTTSNYEAFIAKDEGYDGLIIKNVRYSVADNDDVKPSDVKPSDVYVSFDPKKISNVSKSTLDTLHQTYVETGVHPDQVFEDARKDPSVAADIAAGKVPAAYDHLRPAPPVESGEAPGISASDIGELKNVHAALSRRDAQLQDSAAKISSSLGDLNNLLSKMPRGAVSDQVHAALDQVKEMGNSLGSNDNFNEEKLANTFHDLSDRLGFIRQNITDTNVNKAASAIIDKISDIFLDREMSGRFLARDVADINRKFPGAGTDAKSLQDRIDKESRAWEERNRSRNEAIANKRANDLVNMAIEKQNTEEPEPSAGDQDALQEGGGQGGRGSEPPRGGGAGEPKEGPLSHEPALDNARAFENQLHQLTTNITADKLDVIKRAEAAPDVSNGTWEKLYHHEEDPSGVPLTPEEQAIYDQHVKPIADESSRLYNKLESLGYPEAKDEERPNTPGYTPRYVKGRTRSYGEVLEQDKDGNEVKFGGAAGRSMRKTIDAQKARRFYDAVNPVTGEKTLVYIDKEGNAVSFDTPDKARKFGTFKQGQKIAPGSEIQVDGQTQKLQNTTTKRIEDQTNVRYTKNVFANRMDQLSKLRAAVRNAEFLEAMKNAPEFSNVAIPVTDTAVPPETDGRSWRPPKILQFRNYYMEPKLADALDDFARDSSSEGLASTLNKIGRVMNAVMFINPKAHIDNVFNHMMVERGLVGNIIHAPSTIMNLIRAMKDVYDVSPDYVRALRTGASLPYAKMLSADVHSKLVEKLGFDSDQNPKIWDSLAQAAGYSDVKTMMARFASVPQKVLWFASDAMTLSRINELAKKGGDLEQAIKETEEHMPNYRVPGQVAGSRALSELFANPAIGRFGRYQYGRLASYFRMLNDAFGADKSIGQRAQSFDRMAMIGTYLYMLYPMMDQFWQGVTGDPDAKTTRSGAISIPQAIMDAAKGDKSYGDVLRSVFTPGIPLEIPIELYTGRYEWNGEPIVRQADIDAGRFKQAAIDAANYVGSKLSALGQAGNVAQGKMSAKQMGYGLLGVKTPTPEQVKGRAFYKAKDAKQAARRAAKLQAQRDKE